MVEIERETYEDLELVERAVEAGLDSAVAQEMRTVFGTTVVLAREDNGELPDGWDVVSLLRDARIDLDEGDGPAEREQPLPALIVTDGHLHRAAQQYRYVVRSLRFVKQDAAATVRAWATARTEVIPGFGP